MTKIKSRNRRKSIKRRRIKRRIRSKKKKFHPVKK